MCLVNEKKSNVKEITGYALVVNTQNKNLYKSMFYSKTLPEPEYLQNREYKAHKEMDDRRYKFFIDEIPGFHGFYNIEDAIQYSHTHIFHILVIVKCKFRHIIAEGEIRTDIYGNIPAFRAMYRTIIEEEEV